MITMQRRGESSVQTFSLPLTSLAPTEEKEDPEELAKVVTVSFLFLNIIVLQNCTVKFSASKHLVVTSYKIIYFFDRCFVTDAGFWVAGSNNQL